MTIFLGCGFAAKYREGGGNFSVPLQWMLGLQRLKLDAIVAPHLTNSTGPAVAGYPNLSIPVGIRDSGRPAGMLMYSTFLHEPQLIGFGYALEQALNVRQQPQFLGSVIPIPNGGFCTGQPRQQQVFPVTRPAQYRRIL